jgi:hypothetical protein
VLRAYAYDSLGNWSQAEVSVNVSATGSNTLRVSNIALSASGSKTLTVNGRVTVRNSSGASVSGASVSINWRLPNGSTVSQNATTNSSGVATFTIRSSRGTYTLNVTNVTKTGYTLDTANSVLTKSITR